MRRSTVMGVAMVGGFLLIPAWAADPPKQAQAKPVEFAKAIEGMPLGDLLDHLRDKYEVAISVDEAAFRKIGREKVGQEQINIPKLDSVPVAFVLEIAAYQIGGTIRADGQQITIVPGKRDPAEVLSPASDGLKKKLISKITLEKDVDEATLRDVLDYFSDKGDATIIVAEWSFREAAAKKPRARKAVADMPCQLKAGTDTFQGWLETVARQVGARVLPRGEVVLIVPAGKVGK